MKFDKEIVKKIDDKSARIIILRGSLPLYVICLCLIIFGVSLMIIGKTILSIVFFAFSLVVFAIGIKQLFLKGDRRERYLISQLVFQSIKDAKKSGKNITKEEIEKFKFKNDPIFRDKIMAQVHREKDKEYENNVKKVEKNVKELETKRINEINRINSERWQSVGKGKLLYNLVEGKINVNNKDYQFSSIKGARLYKRQSSQLITTETGKSKKHGSLGGAIIGTAIAGPLGGVVGGSTLGKTTTNSKSITNTIYFCEHLGVVVDIDNFKTEIVILDKKVNQASAVYMISLKQADDIVEKLLFLANQPVPKNIIKVENEQTVLDIDLQIKKAKKDLEKIKNNKPIYEIPDKYLDKKGV